MEALAVFLVALGTALATGLGALPFAFNRYPTRNWLGIANSLASGFMIGASLGLCYQGAKQDVSRTAIGVGAGVAFIWWTGRLIERRRVPHLGALEGADARKALLIVGVMTLHSITEGIGVGVAFGGEEALGLLIAIAIAVHNIPEGLAISLVLVSRGASVRSAAGWSIFSSLPQPLLAVPAFLFVEEFTAFLPLGLGFAAGAMLWLVLADLCRRRSKQRQSRSLRVAVAGFALAMLAFLLVLL